MDYFFTTPRNAGKRFNWLALLFLAFAPGTPLDRQRKSRGMPSNGYRECSRRVKQMALGVHKNTPVFASAGAVSPIAPRLVRGRIYDYWYEDHAQ